MINRISLDYYEHQAIKSALHMLLKSAISDLDKTNRLFIGKRGFEFNYRDEKEYKVVLSIEEVKEDE